MGLDMYLVFDLGEHDGNPNDSIDERYEEVAYWRKANMIHNWFDTRLACGQAFENGGYYTVQPEFIDDLLTLVNKILSYYDKNPKFAIKVARELLPTTRGFFFGCYDYDEWYFQDLLQTQKMLREVKNHAWFGELPLKYTADW